MRAPGWRVEGGRLWIVALYVYSSHVCKWNSRFRVSGCAVWEPLELAEPWHMSMARKRGLGSAFEHK